MPYRSFPRGVLLALSICLLATACAASSASQSSGSRPDTAGVTGAEMQRETSSRPDLGAWAAIQASARGQTVRWWLYGGDERVNRYIDEHVVPAASHAGVRLERVPLADTADARQIRPAEFEIVHVGPGAYVVVLPGLSAEDALIVLGEIRQHFAGHPVDGVPGEAPAASVGVAAAPTHGSDAESLIRAARATSRASAWIAVESSMWTPRLKSLRGSPLM